MREKLIFEGEKEKEHEDIPKIDSQEVSQKDMDFLEHYAKGMVKIVEGDSNYINLISKQITIDPKRYEGLDFSTEMTNHSKLHEIEHLVDLLELLKEEGGDKVFEKYLKHKEASQAFSLMDNCVADIHVNRAVISKTNKGMIDLEKKKIKEKLFVETDYTNSPKHIQFCQSLFRENRVTDEKCKVSPEVRNAIDEVNKVKGLVDIMTNPATPMSMRLKLQDKYIWPKVEELLEKDKEDKNNQEDKGEGESSDSDGKKGDENQEKHPSENNDSNDQGNSKDSKKDEQKGKPEKGNGKIEPKEADPNKMFAEDYEKAFQKNPNTLPNKDLKKAFEEYKEEKAKNSPDKADQEYAEKLGVEKKDLQEYRKIAEALQKIVNPETNVGIMEELKNLFSRIIAKRMKERLSPKYPVEEGDELSDPAQLVSDVKSGNLSPKVWEDTEIKEKKGDRFGEIEITLVCDRSGSMTDGDGQKAVEQRNSAVLMMEVLKDFAEMCDEEKMKVDKPLEIKSEIYSFASSEEDKTPLKKMSKELGEAERINVLKKLQDLPGSTTDFNCLEAINEKLENETKQKIAIGELKKIVFVFTDGGSDSVGRVQKALKSLRDTGIVVIGVGLTQAGAPAETTYAPNAQVVNNVADLPIVLGGLLKEHLKDI